MEKNINLIHKYFNKKNEHLLANSTKKIQNGKNSLKEINKNNDNEEVSKKPLNLKTPQKMKPIINKSSLTTKNKLVEEKKNDDKISFIKWYIFL